jgi:hypothetical protein
MREQNLVSQRTQAWLVHAVIGLNLCPFAKAVHVKGQIHYAVSNAQDAEALRADLQNELLALAQMPSEVRDTTLLIAPQCLHDFWEFNLFTAEADKVLRLLGLQGQIQIAPFHPQFVFAGVDENDISHFTNRSPYPMLHLLRESSIDRAVAAYPDAAEIYERNMHVLESLGPQGWNALAQHFTPGTSDKQHSVDADIRHENT